MFGAFCNWLKDFWRHTDNTYGRACDRPRNGLSQILPVGRSW
jgi:hypothetical protein